MLNLSDVTPSDSNQDSHPQTFHSKPIALENKSKKNNNDKHPLLFKSNHVVLHDHENSSISNFSTKQVNHQNSSKNFFSITNEEELEEAIERITKWQLLIYEEEEKIHLYLSSKNNYK